MPPKSENSNVASTARNNGTEAKSNTAAEKRRIAAAAAAANANAIAPGANHSSTGLGSSSNTLTTGGSVASSGNQGHGHASNDGMSWDNIPLSVLHAYRSAYRLKTPSACHSYHSMVLACGIGKKSPTSLARRTSRETLVTAVRKHFSSQPINENEAIVSFLYTVKNQDKSFRQRFPTGPPANR